MSTPPLSLIYKLKTGSSINFQEGVSSYQKADYNAAFSWFRKGAEERIAEAQNNLGVMCYEVRGTIQNYTESVQWIRKSSEHKLPEAQHNLGNLYRHGLGVTQNDREAIKWYLLAAKQGFTKSQFNLGTMYYNGFGTPQNYSEAVKWIRPVAEKGDAEAQHNLGVAYDRGQGVAQDHVKAFHWFELAAKQGKAESQHNLGYAYEQGEGVEQNHIKSVRWYELAADQGNSESQFNLGVMYTNGLGVKENFTKAIHWFQLAADQGHVDAEHNLEVATELRQAKLDQLGSIHVCVWSDYFMAQHQYNLKNTQFTVPADLEQDFIDWLSVSIRDELRPFYTSEKKEFVSFNLTADQIESVTDYINYLNMTDRRKYALVMPDFYLDGEKIILSTVNTYCHVLGKYLNEIVNSPTVSDEDLSGWARENYEKFYVTAHSLSLKALAKSGSQSS